MISAKFQDTHTEDAITTNLLDSIARPHYMFENKIESISQKSVIVTALSLIVFQCHCYLAAGNNH